MKNGEIILQIIILGMFCAGWVTLLMPNMLLSGLDNVLNKLPIWIYKPLGGCVPCSASIVGLIGYALLNYIPYGVVIVTILSIVPMVQIVWFLKENMILALQEKRTIVQMRQAQLKQIEKVKESSNQCKTGCGDGKENNMVETSGE